MAAHPPTVSVNRFASVLDDLPDEVLEYILSLVPPYKDLQNCSLVCKRWQRSVKNVVRHSQKNLFRAISEFNIMWKDVTPIDLTPSITKRYSHSACRYGNSMYVFGGCTSTSTTFNDLWRLDLNKRQWERPLTMGSYPAPKACASIVCYKDALILFGGWTHPSPYPLHQAWRLFNELHMYSIVSNRWTCINTTAPPPATAGHSCTIHKENMVVFGGLQNTNLMGQYMSSNDIWTFNLDNHTWNKQMTSDAKPHPRYGQSQIALDDTHVLILGGCGGPNMVFSDVWLLSMNDPVWIWQEVSVKNLQCAPTHMWCHPACKVGEHVVVFSRSPVSSAPVLAYSAQWNAPSQLRSHGAPLHPREDESPLDLTSRRVMEGTVEPRPVDRDANVNGRRGTLGPRPSLAVPSTSSSSGEDSEPELGVQQSLANRKAAASAVASSAVARPEASGNALEPSSSSPGTSRAFMGTTLNDVDLSEPAPGGIGMAAFRDPSPGPRLCPNRNRQRQLESLRRMEERLRSLSRSSSSSNGGSSSSSSNSPTKPEPPNTTASPSHSSPQLSSSLKRNAMAMFVLNISNVLTAECSVEWLPIKNSSTAAQGPEEMILYTLIAGKGELIMFGGILKDASSITAQAQVSSTNVPNTVSNSLYFISAPKGVI